MINKFLFTLFLFFNSAVFSEDLVEKLVMINPAGHAKNAGRRLVACYERSETFKFAECLQQKLQETYQVKAVLTRYPGEEVIDWELASFANRLNVDFYLSIHLYREESVKPRVFLYNLTYNPLVDYASRVFDPFSFVPVYNAHYRNIHKTKLLGINIKNMLLQEEYKKRFDFYGLFGIPIKPLCGIIAPALLIEVGIYKDDQWKAVIDPLVASLGFLGNTI